MKALKIILIILVIIIAVPLLIALFVKKDYAVEREVTINRSKQEVFDYVKYLKNQDNYSKWATMDPDMDKSYRGTDGTVGFVSAWDGDKAGEGEQEITNIIEGERIDYELRFLEPMESTSKAYMITEPVSDSQTRVKWGFSGHMDYPMNFLLLVMNMEKMLGDDFETGLVNLKVALESKTPVTPGG
ncbi:SRPBCC family protein [Parapedobacter sp. DT-150]|uniref:SRPBCC family protein n=1 Tax=Parapedobacter sp. DT-150 TaxID=3396162 RepID=UPI003F1CF16C